MMTSYNCLSVIAVCKRCKASLASLSKRELDLANDGNYSDDGNEGDHDKSDNDQEVTIAAKHLVFQKEVRKCFTFARSKVTAMPLSWSMENINRYLYGLTRT